MADEQPAPQSSQVQAQAHRLWLFRQLPIGLWLIEFERAQKVGGRAAKHRAWRMLASSSDSNRNTSGQRWLVCVMMANFATQFQSTFSTISARLKLGWARLSSVELKRVALWDEGVESLCSSNGYTFR